jgi:hypothetical protein
MTIFEFSCCCLLCVRRLLHVVNGVRESRFSQLRTDLQTTGGRGNRLYYGVVITNPTRKEGDHQEARWLAATKLQKERSYKSGGIHLLPWRVEPAIPLVAGGRGGPSQKIRELISLCFFGFYFYKKRKRELLETTPHYHDAMSKAISTCATLAKSNAALGFNLKLERRTHLRPSSCTTSSPPFGSTMRT